MLRTVLALLVLCLVAAVAGTAVTGHFWLSLVGMAGALMFGASALSLVRPAADEEADGGADLRPLTPARRLPGRAARGRGAGWLSRAA